MALGRCDNEKGGGQKNLDDVHDEALYLNRFRSRVRIPHLKFANVDLASYLSYAVTFKTSFFLIYGLWEMETVTISSF